MSTATSAERLAHVGDTWESIALTDARLRLDALVVVRELVRLIDTDGDGDTIRVSMRSLGDAVARRDRARRTVATAQRGLGALIQHGYVVRLNPDAPRRERGQYLLTVPASRLHD